MTQTRVRSAVVDIFDDLVAEQDRLEAILASLDTAAWETESGAPGWTITDVVVHLAQTEEAVVATAPPLTTPTAARVGAATTRPWTRRSIGRCAPSGLNPARSSIDGGLPGGLPSLRCAPPIRAAGCDGRTPR